LIVQAFAAKRRLGDHGLAVTPIAILSFLPALFGLFAVQSGSGQPISRLVSEDEMILRVPVQPKPVSPRLDWVEHKGPKCIPVEAIRRAMLSGPDQVDFVLMNKRRIRAEFDNRCPALDFYGGFYLRTEDGRLCADRDEIHSRMGGSCTIERFKQLVPRIPPPKD
jgi:hypothetical protein